MNLILWTEGSSAAIPFGTLVAILALWFGISVPLTFVGAYFGFKKAVSFLLLLSISCFICSLSLFLCIFMSLNLFLFPSPLQAIEQPVRTNQIPRQIPEQSFFTKPIPGIVMGGILPFGCIFIQLFFILNSIWLDNWNVAGPDWSAFCVWPQQAWHNLPHVLSFRSHQMYYMFGFLFLVFIILLITCSEATILLCYFHLCAEVDIDCVTSKTLIENKFSDLL